MILGANESLHLTYGASDRPEKAATFSARDEIQNIYGISPKPLRCEDPASPFTVIYTIGHFLHSYKGLGRVFEIRARQFRLTIARAKLTREEG